MCVDAPKFFRKPEIECLHPLDAEHPVDTHESARALNNAICRPMLCSLLLKLK
jgi:hypothetical protein